MPSVKTNGYFNNAAFAQAASNIASLFEPPSGADAAGWATADAKRAEAKRLADFFKYQTGPDYDRETADRMGVGAGSFTPNQSFYRVDQDNATSRANNAADNARAIQQTEISSLTDLFKPVSEDAMRPEIPADVAGRLGVNRSLPAVQGNRSPVSETEWSAAQRERLRQDGQLGDSDILDLIFSDKTPVQAVGEDGRPTFMLPGAAVRTGAEPFVNGGSEPKPDVVNYRAPDGRAGTAVYDAELGLVDTQSRQPLPQGTQTFKSQAQGTADDVLGQSTQNRIDKQLIDAAVAKDVAVKLRDMVATSPASQGVVGWLRGTAQNVIAAGGEVGQYFGGSVDDIQKRIANGLEDQDLAGAFDTNIPAIELMANVLAFQYAKLQGADRLSNEMVRATRSALGLDGLTANQQSSVARLNQAIKMIESQEGILRGARGGGVNAVESAAPPAPPPAAIDNGGAVERWQRDPSTGKLIKVQ